MNIADSRSPDQVCILVVDDHPNTASTLARALAQLGPGVVVISASSGREALDKVKDRGVDILITDMVMPEMTGLELIEKMQNHHGGRPAYSYLITAYDIPGLKVTANRLNVTEVIIKPVRPERIREMATKAVAELQLTSKPSETAPVGKKRFKILVADDRQDNVILLTRYLEYEGYDQISAHDGVETLDRIREHLPDLVLLDVNMPNKDGFAVLREIRADPMIGHIPVIILTAARLDPGDVKSGLNLGADDYVTKPFDRHELMARIRTKLRVKEAEEVIRHRNMELNLLPEIGKLLSAGLDTDELMDSIIRQTVATLGALFGRFMILDRNGDPHKERHISATETFSTEAPLPYLSDFLDSMRKTREGLIIDDTSRDLRWRQLPGEAFRSVIMAPLFGRVDLIGALMLIHAQAGYFNSEHQLLLQAIANQAAIAVENIQLYEQIKSLSE